VCDEAAVEWLSGEPVRGQVLSKHSQPSLSGHEEMHSLLERESRLREHNRCDRKPATERVT
jgi:hypothetical protein